MRSIKKSATNRWGRLDKLKENRKSATFVVLSYIGVSRAKVNRNLKKWQERQHRMNEVEFTSSNKNSVVEYSIRFWIFSQMSLHMLLGKIDRACEVRSVEVFKTTMSLVRNLNLLMNFSPATTLYRFSTSSTRQK